MGTAQTTTTKVVRLLQTTGRQRRVSCCCSWRTWPARPKPLLHVVPWVVQPLLLLLSMLLFMPSDWGLPTVLRCCWCCRCWCFCWCCWLCYWCSWTYLTGQAEDSWISCRECFSFVAAAVLVVLVVVHDVLGQSCWRLCRTSCRSCLVSWYINIGVMVIGVMRDLVHGVWYQPRTSGGGGEECLHT